MHAAPDPTADLVLLGAGHAHVEVLRRLARRPDPRLRLTLIAREPRTPYSGRLPALIRGEHTPADAHIDLGPLAASAEARLIIAEATAIDLASRQVTLRNRPAIQFDWLSIDIGGVPAMPAGAGIAVKPIGGFLAALARLEGELGDGARVVLVGGGAAGTELALALAQRFAARMRLTLVCDADDPLSEAPPRARAVARAALAEARIELVCGVRAGTHTEGRLALSDGSVLAADAVLWVTNAVGPPLLAASGLMCDAAGCVVVDAGLRSRGHDFVFAAGDCASIDGAPRPKAGVWAVRAGPVLTANLRRAARGKRPRPWRPQTEALAIIGLGHGRAIGWRNSMTVSGRFVAWYKDWIDGRFLRRYAPAALPRQDVRAEPAQVSLDPADIAVLAEPSGQQTQAAREAFANLPAGAGLVQQATHLPAPLNDPFSFGRIAAAHALVRLHAAGAQPLTAVAVAAPASTAPEPARADVMAMLQGVATVLAADGAALIDGATAVGGRPALSLALTGQSMRSRIAGAALGPGDGLILTKPLGSGIVLEAYRRGLAEAGWLLDAIEVMTRSSAAAARILRQHEASSCTEVAARGVVGTLATLLRDANLAAVLSPNDVPALPGARALVRLRVERPEAAENRQAWPDPPDWPDLALLADPQIAGGLLAGVPAGRAAACLAALHAAGYEAACIGWTEARRLEMPRLRLGP
jgi:selenide,water dikinase